MYKALIGYTGFIGTTLRQLTTFDEMFRSTDIKNICGRKYDIVVGAGAPAKKWYANQNPEEDYESINKLIEYIDTIKTNLFILISTVDVFKTPINVNESTSVNIDGLHPYGFNRYRLEQFISNRFKKSLIVRLPGLVGTGLKKNIIFDFLNNNNINNIESRNIFQFYPVCNLWKDIKIALNNNLKIIHLTSTPLSVQTIAERCFNHHFINLLKKPLVRYDMKSIYAHIWNKVDYQYSESDSLEAIKQYAKTETRSL